MIRILSLLLLPVAVMAATFNPIPTAPQTVYGLPLLSKGALITSDGVQNGETTVCADGEILEWQSADTDGVVCVAKPTTPIMSRATSTGLYYSGISLGTGLSRTSTTLVGGATPTTLVSQFSVDVTHSGGPLKVVITNPPAFYGSSGAIIGNVGNDLACSAFGGSFCTGSISFDLNGTRIFASSTGDTQFDYNSTHFVYEIENAAAGSYQVRGYYSLASDNASAELYPNFQPYVIYAP